MSSSITKCPICKQPVEGGAGELDRHVNDHLDSSEEERSRKVALELSGGASAQDIPQQPNTDVDDVEELLGPAERMMLEVEKNDAALAVALTEPAQVDDTDMYIYPSLRGSLSDSAERYYPNILQLVQPRHDTIDVLLQRKCHMCSKLDLFSSNNAGLGWDCGYRNIQMMFSALLRSPGTRAELKAAGIREVPCIPEIAGRIESAWKNGYDPEGAKNFCGALVDKEVWIGATEAFVLFRSINCNASLTDFETPTVMQRRELYEWIYNYFQERCNGRHCSIHRKTRGSVYFSMVSPLFCQWQGHSVTIIGVEKTRGGEIELLVLDPSRAFYTSLMGGSGPRLSLTRRDLLHPQFSHPRFQLVSVVPKQLANNPPGRQNRRGVLGRLRPGGPS